MQRVMALIFIGFFFLLATFNTSEGYEKEIKALSSSLADGIAQSGKKTIAVVDFVDLQGNVTELGRFLAEELSVAISESGKGLEVVDRTHLKSLLKEHQLAMTGLIDPGTAKKIGEIAGVQVIVTGTLTPLGDTIRLAVKALDTGTARMIGGTRGDIAKTRAIEELLGKGIDIPAPISPKAPTTATVSPPSPPKTKKVGDTTISLNKILISRSQATVFLEVFNNSEKKLDLGFQEGGEFPNLMDEKGNSFTFEQGLGKIAAYGYRERGQTLSPKLGSDLVLYFKIGEQINAKEIGDIFTFSAQFYFCALGSQYCEKHNVNFSDMKAQKTR